MKVLMFGWEFPPHISGGLGTACFGLTQAMAENNDTPITFVLPKLKGENRVEHLELIGANQVRHRILKKKTSETEETIHTIQIEAALRPYVNDIQYKRLVEKYKQQQETSEFELGSVVVEVGGDYGADLVSEVKRYGKVGPVLVRHESFDIIHAHDWMTFHAAVAAKSESGLPLVVHVHSTEFDRSGESPNQPIYDIERMGMDAADKIIAVSQLTKDIILKHYGQPADKVQVIHNAITKEAPLDKGSVDRPLKEKIVLFLGRITMQKGPDYYLEAAERVLKAVKNVRFVMAGSGDMLPKMIERAAEKRLEDRFHFTGFLRGLEREKIFSMSDVYVMPSVSEPFGITPFEVMKYGVPVIVSRQSGITEVLENIIKVDFWDTNTLANSIIEVLTNPEYAKGLVEGGNRELAAIDWSTPANKIKALYREMLLA